MPEPRTTTPAPRIPTSGALRFRVRYCECDPQGVAHHAAYIPWLEMGRTELLRDAGLSYANLEHDGVFLVVVKLECSYRRPAHYDDLLEVRTRVVGSSRVKLRHEYEIFRVESGREGSLETPEMLMAASSLLACVDRTGRPSMMPDWLTSIAPERP
jgi:acyl-CoA thioester hydrolase